MIYAPVPQALKSVSTDTYEDYKYRIFGTNGLLKEAGSVRGLSTRLYGYVERTKGKKITLAGRPWSPVRNYMRVARLIQVVPGESVRWNRSPSGYRYQNGMPFPHINSTFSGCGVWPTGMDDAIPPNTLARINTELLLKVGDRKVNYGEAIAEGRETVQMLVKSASTLLRGVLAARKGQWSRLPKIFGVQKANLRSGMSQSDKWLAYQYGWAPLMSDVYDSYNLFKEGLRRSPQLLSATRSLTNSRSLRFADTSYYKDASGRLQERFTAKCFFRLRDSDIDAFHRLGLINPLEVAWAVVPFSFVVDWFLPVGNVLEALTARVGVSFVDGYYGTRRESIVLVDPIWDSSTEPLYRSSTKVRTEMFCYKRSKMGSLPWPSPYVKNPFSTSHVTSALALLRQLWR